MNSMKSLKGKSRRGLSLLTFAHARSLQLIVRAAKLMVTSSSGVFVVPPSDSG